MLELLDQVEDVISVEDSITGKVDESPCHIQDNNMDEVSVKGDIALKGAVKNPPMVAGLSDHHYFLVLEVLLMLECLLHKGYEFL